MDNGKLILVMIASSPQDANEMAQQLIDRRLVACVNIVDNVSSVFFWQGQRATENESLLICKTTEQAWPLLQKFINEYHPYEIPELVAWPLTHASKEYETWVQKEVNA